ncbi:AraC family transcriptional regulator [Corallococcus llansteffanensis]|uniref:AraC family transcriptional regulator n=1 Tax=Corallococcus llansteffanensis TaxID=2316731 RepID=A0A3A8P745_9BACT|nr:AraC family transcriptional regulator [Corallococcus llansteffanensis]RKH52173.1 AraC family transcriptional regulator [Corallococcus llansteffanensis]
MHAPAPHAATHAHAALILYTGGRATIEQRTRLTLSPGDVLLIPSGEKHRLVTTDRAEILGLGFHPAAFLQSEVGPLLEPFERVRQGASAVVPIPSGRQEHLVRLLSELREETRAPFHPLGEQVVRSLFSLVLAEVARSGGAWTPTDSRASLVGEALTFIERHCLEPISLREVAAAVGRSPAHVTTALKQATGHSVVEWIISGRLAEARRRLLSTDERIDIIAERVGYADPTHFIRLFRRAEGLTPALWRRQHRTAPALSAASSAGAVASPSRPCSGGPRLP